MYMLVKIILQLMVCLTTSTSVAPHCLQWQWEHWTLVWSKWKHLLWHLYPCGEDWADQHHCELKHLKLSSLSVFLSLIWLVVNHEPWSLHWGFRGWEVTCKLHTHSVYIDRNINIYIALYSLVSGRWICQWVIFCGLACTGWVGPPHCRHPQHHSDRWGTYVKHVLLYVLVQEDSSWLQQIWQTKY